MKIHFTTVTDIIFRMREACVKIFLSYLYGYVESMSQRCHIRQQIWITNAL